MENEIEIQIEKRLKEQEEKLNKIYISVEKTRKYFLFTLIGTLLMFIVPFIIMLILMPRIMSLYSDVYSNILSF